MAGGGRPFISGGGDVSPQEAQQERLGGASGFSILKWNWREKLDRQEKLSRVPEALGWEKDGELHGHGLTHLPGFPVPVSPELPSALSISL